MITDADLVALALTGKLALVTTLLLLVIGTPLAWWLARSRWRFKYLIEALVALPLVLPPTVLGFYLLLALGGTGLAFSFPGLVIGSACYSLPFVVQPLQQAFAAIAPAQLEAAAMLGAGPLDRFWTIALPLARPGFITAAVLGFAHTVGEFGVVLMIGGNIPGETQVLSIAIYDQVESLAYNRAHILAGGLLLLSLAMLIPVYALRARRGDKLGQGQVC